MRKKGLIFDFNGVLLLDIHLHYDVWKEVAFEISGKLLTREDFERYFSGRTNDLIFEYLTGKKLELKELEQWTIKKELAYQRLARKNSSIYKLATGATELFEELRRRDIPYTIATSSPTVNIKFYGEMLGLEKWFDMNKIVHDDGTLRGKPAPDIYLRAADILELNPKDCVVVEDAISGIAAAYAAGIGHIIAIGPQNTHEILQNIEGVNEVVASLSQIDLIKLFG